MEFYNSRTATITLTLGQICIKTKNHKNVIELQQHCKTHSKSVKRLHKLKKKSQQNCNRTTVQPTNVKKD